MTAAAIPPGEADLEIEGERTTPTAGNGHASSPPVNGFAHQQNVLGGLLADGRNWLEVSDLVREEDYAPQHRPILSAVAALAADGRPHDVLTVAGLLEDREHLAVVGGIEALSRLARETVTAANVREYARRVRLLALEGRLPQELREDPEAEARVAQIITERSELERPAKADRGVPARAPLEWQALDGKTPPAREWVLEHWLPQAHPSLLAGRAGIGKTLLAQHLATAVAFAQPYIDEIRRPLKVLLWAGEDNDIELWRRQLPICAHFGVKLPELDGRVILQSYEGEDITLAAPAFGVLAPTPMLAELTEQVHDYRADYVFLDNIARIYGGNESDRHSVTQFLAWLTAACRPAGVCLLGHPAKTAGSEYSGSTAWEGAVRARLYLSDRLPDAEPADDDAEPDPGVRYLSRRKSNYSPKDWRRLDYRDGALVPENAQPVPVGAIGGDFARDIVRHAVRKLEQMGFHGNTSTRSPDYLPKLAKQYGLLDRLAEKRFGGFMRDMLKDGELLVQTVGQYSNRSPKPGLVLK